MKTWLRLVSCRAYSKAAMVIGLSASFALVSPHAWSATNSAPSSDPCLASPQPSYCKSEPPSAAPSTIVVGPKEKIHSIQAALDNIKSGRRSTIIVKPKSRPGEAYKEALKISKSVTIKADPEGQVTIQAPDGQCITIEPTSGYKAVSLVGLVIEQSCIITADADLALDDILMTTKSNSAIDVRSGHLFLGTDGSKLLPSSEKTASHPTSVRMTGAGTDGSAGSNDGIVSAYNSPVTIHYADLSGFHTALKVRAGADLQDSYIDHNGIGRGSLPRR